MIQIKQYYLISVYNITSIVNPWFYPDFLPSTDASDQAGDRTQEWITTTYTNSQWNKPVILGSHWS